LQPRKLRTFNSSSSSNGIESNNEQYERRQSTPVVPLYQQYGHKSDAFLPTSPKSPGDKPSLLQKYNLVKEENIQLHKMLVETQSKLIDVQQQLIIIQNEQQIQQSKVIMEGNSRKKSLAAITERQRKLSRSLDSLQHALILTQIDN